MITITGTVNSYEVEEPSAEERRGEERREGRAGLPPGVAVATIVVTASEPSGGSVTFVVPNAAAGGVALGPCRIILDQA
jgi:hypothetical protein